MTDASTQFQPYAVESRSGPHVTMQAGVVHAGRYWTTTAAGSLKARSVRAHGYAAAIVDDGDHRRIVSGPTVALRPFRPWRAVGDPVAGLRWGSALVRLGRTHLDQLLGYLEASASVPKEWLPTHRVLLVTRIERSLTLAGPDIVEREGEWGSERDVDLAAEVLPSRAGALPIDDLPAAHRAVVRSGARPHVGISTPVGPVPLPARWDGDDRFAVSAAALTAVGADVNGRVSAVFHQSESRRPDDKRGVLFRGTSRVVNVVGPEVIIAVDTDHITTWDGFAAATVDVGAPMAA